MASSWIAYDELAWTEELLAEPTDHEAEIGILVDLIRRNSPETPRTLLHLGSGAGSYDTFFKQHFAVTGVDVSGGMLEIAGRRNPHVEYCDGDMRTVRLGREFDAVVIPDSIDYMASRLDLRLAIETAVAHLKPGGVLVVVGKPREVFQDNNFAYTGSKEDLHITLLENNYLDPYHPESYRATLVYLIRQRGELTIRTDCHVLGLFSLEVWEKVFAEARLSLQVSDLDGIYDPYLLGGGRYPQRVFIGRRH